MSLLHHVVTFKRRSLLCLSLLDGPGLVYFGSACAHHRFSESYRIEWTAWTRWSWLTPRFQAAVSDSINLRLIVGFSWLSPRLLYARESQSDSYPVIDRQGQRPDAVLAPPPDYQFGTMKCSLSSFKQNEYCNKAMLMVPHTSAVGIYRWFGHIDSSIDNVQLHYNYMSHATPDYDLQKMLHCQIQALRLEFF